MHATIYPPISTAKGRRVSRRCRAGMREEKEKVKKERGGAQFSFTLEKEASVSTASSSPSRTRHTCNNLPPSSEIGGSRRCGLGRREERKREEKVMYRTYSWSHFLGGEASSVTVASFPCLSEIAGGIRRRCRPIKINILIKQTLRLFVGVLTSAAQC